MAIESPFAFSICPRIQCSEERLIASTGWMACLMTLGLYYRRITFDRTTRTITIERRMGWFVRRVETIGFDHVVGVTYGYQDANPLSDISSTHDAIDKYVVGLQVVGRGEVELFTFSGDGEFTNDGGLPDWWYWKEYATDVTGGQQRESLMFVRLLSKLLGVSIGPSGLT